MNEAPQIVRDISSNATPISIEDVPMLREMFSRNSKDNWCYFAPFLASYSLFPKRVIFWYEKKGVSVLFQRKMDRSNRTIELMVPPIPLDENGLRIMSDIMMDSANVTVKILWVNESEKRILKSAFTDHIKIDVKEEEYIYDPNLIYHMKGGRYRDLRKRVNSVAKINPVFRPMESNDVIEAVKLLRNWRSKQGRKRNFLLDWGYTLNALENISKFSREDLYSWVVEIQGQISAIAMAGPINDKSACFFVAKSDTGIYGLSEYLRWKVYGELREFTRVNDAGDLGINGLRQYKQKFRPLKLDRVYTASF